MTGDGAAQQGAGDRADGRSGRAVGAALFTGFLGHREGRNQGRSRDGGGKGVFAHG